ncbi:hypothetical protein EIN_084480 [Entamoeba invadens IP1]|uniref:hypothetical protein n=1 Tax=Entamoeba invadens IP1 TaxID=370355 RepID=UPI0002C3E60D|nr:hypothetical protein EIN_084480 [Entamoeba invadens IP1]ELP85266.1 hypothetical protein EIN_084480 [Entamoeba invadens IP1]|eukprot:XP_004184612.1 hypothetical protein EIN_084480 [Entamoeba invadens IP1]
MLYPILRIAIFCFFVLCSSKSKSSKRQKIYMNGIEQPNFSQYHHIKEVTSTEFRSLFESENYVIALFCYFTQQSCVPYIQTIENFAKKNKMIKYVVVDGINAEELVFDYQIDDFPYIIFHRGLYKDRVYRSDDFDDFQSFITRGISPVVHEILETDMVSLERQKKITYFTLYTTPNTTQSEIDEYTDIADIFTEYTEIGFFAIFNASNTYLNNKSMNIIYYNNQAYDDVREIIHYQTITRFNNTIERFDVGITEWVVSVGVPLFNLAVIPLLQLFEVLPNRTPMLWYMNETISDTTRLEFIRKARAYRGKVGFVYTPEIEEVEYLRQTTRPSITVVHKNLRTMYPLAITEPKDVDMALENIFSGATHESVKSSVGGNMSGIPILTGEMWENGISEYENATKIILLVDSSLVSKNLVRRELAAVYRRTKKSRELNEIVVLLFNIEKDDAPKGVYINEVPTIFCYLQGENVFESPKAIFAKYPQQDDVIHFISKNAKTENFEPHEDEKEWPEPIEDDEEEKERRQKNERLDKERIQKKKEMKEAMLTQLMNNPFKNQEFVKSIHTLGLFTDNKVMKKAFDQFEFLTKIGVDVNSLEGVASLKENEDNLRRFELERRKTQKTKDKTEL